MRIPHGLRSALASQAAAAPTDEYFGDVSLLLYGDGTNGSTAIVDSSSNGHAITVNGDAQISTAQSKFGGASMYFDGTGDYITAPSDSSFDFGTGDFTIEFWMNPSNITGTWQAIISRKYQGSGGWRIYKTAGSNNLSFYHPSGYYSTTNTGLTNGTWHHIAVVRSGSTLTTYVDGTSRGTDTISLAMSPTSADVEIGQGVYTSSYPYEGYLDDIRITKGVARYTSNFTPPTASFSTVTPGEKYFYQNSLLLSADGSNGSTAIVDSSANSHTITANGDAQISTTQSKFGGSSMYFDGTGDYLATPVSDTLSLGTSDFTIECWAWRLANAPANSVLLQMSNSADVYSALFGFASSGNFLVYLSSAGTSWDIASGEVLGSIDNETWVHYALTRQGSTFRTFKNGVQQSIWTSSASIYQASNQVRIGAGQPYAACNYGGYIDDLRITKGVARYTSDFSIPTSEASSSDPYFSSTKLLLNGNGTNGSTTFTDSSNSSYTVTANGNAQISTAQSKFGSASMYFDGTGDYLTVSNATASDVFGSGDFTWEAWINPSTIPSSSNNTDIFGIYDTPGAPGIIVGLNGSNIRFYVQGTLIYSSGTALSTNTWYHVAVTRQGIIGTIFINGVPSGVGTLYNAPTSNNFSIGRPGSYVGNYFHGYIDDFRITKGVARYGNFAVPTAGFSTLTPVEPYFHNNSLLLHGDGTNGSTTFKDDSINNHTITANGNAQISTAQSKFGGASMYFDGNGDYLSIADDDAFNFGSGDFTMETWVYMTSQGSYNFLVGQYGSSSSVSTTFWSIANGYNDCYFYYGSSSVRLSGTTSIPLNTWTHVAVAREGNTVRLFTNGQVDASSSFTQTLNNSTLDFTIGADSTAAYDFAGYMDDIRVTKGVARYTANFTPPTSAFPDL